MGDDANINPWRGTLIISAGLLPGSIVSQSSANVSSGSSLVLISGGTLTVSNNYYFVGTTATHQILTITGGLLSATGGLNIGFGNPGAAIITLAGGILHISTVNNLLGLIPSIINS